MKQKSGLIFVLLTLCQVIFFFAYLRPFDEVPDISDRKLIQYKAGEKELNTQVAYIVYDSLRYQSAQRVPFLKKMDENENEIAYFKMIQSAIPTYTTTAVKTMMTGSNLFEYGKIYEMMTEHHISMDNIIHQLTRNNKKAIAMGDNIWIKTYQFPKGGDLTCERPYDIFQFKTCDQRIYTNFQKSVTMRKENSSDPAHNLVIAHSLQLDHTAHSGGVEGNPKVTQVLSFINDIVQNYTKMIPNDTLMLVLGDHGNQQDGCHSGVTHWERQVGFFSYLKSDRQDKNIKKSRFNSTLRMIDVASTLSILLNVPCPSNSIGFPILDIFPSAYHKYFPQIQFNVLQQYKRQIDFQGIQRSMSCAKINNWLKDSEANLDSLHAPTYYYERREKIIDELYTDCITQINLANPHYAAWIVLTIASVLIVIMWIGLYSTEQRKASESFIMDQISWAGSKFMIAFTPVLMYIQLPYLQILVITLISITRSISWRSKVVCIFLLMVMSQFQLNFLSIYQHTVFYSKDVSIKLKASQSFFLGGFVLWSGYIIYNILKHWQPFFNRTKVLFSRSNHNNDNPSVSRSHSKCDAQVIVALFLLFAEFLTEILIVVAVIINQIYNVFKIRNFELRINLVFIILSLIAIRIFYSFLKLKSQTQSNKNQQTRDYFQKFKIFFTFEFKLSHIVILFTTLFWNNHQLFLVIAFQKVIQLVNSKRINMMVSFIVAEIAWRSFGITYQLSSIEMEKSFAFGEEFVLFKNCFVFVFYFSSLHLIAFAEIYQNVTDHQQKNREKFENRVFEHEQIYSPDAGQYLKQTENDLKKPKRDENQLQVNSAVEINDQFGVQSSEYASDFTVQHFWNQIPRYFFVPLVGLISASIHLAIRTGRQQSMEYVLMMVMQFFELAYALLIALLFFLRSIATSFEKYYRK